MKSNKGQYLKLGITIFASLAATVAFFFLLFRSQELKAFLSVILSALQPVFIGIVLAYLLCPIARFLERQIRRVKVLGKAARPLSALLTLLLAVGVVGLFCALIIPQLADSVGSLVSDLPDLLQAQFDRLSRYLDTDSEAAAAVLQMIESAETYLLSWIRTNLFSTISTVVSSVMSIGSALVNLVVAIIVTIYLLLDRERYVAQCKKLFYAVSRNERLDRAVMETAHRANEIFLGFIGGKLLDSLIVGIICFICLLVMKMPYTLLISVIVGVTNVIPVFGPFIGAIPSAFLILLVSPSKCVAFLLFIVVLQQIDGNILGPRILGDSTGLSALYVMVATLVFGKLMGFAGMIVGVPLFATLYHIVKRLAEWSLSQRDLPVDTSDYIDGPEQEEKT